MSSTQEAHSYLSAPSPNPSNNGSNETYIDPSPVAPSSSGTEFTDLDEAVEHRKEIPSEAKRVVRSHPPTLRQPELSVGEENDVRAWTYADILGARSKRRHLQDLYRLGRDLMRTNLLNLSYTLRQGSQNLYVLSLAAESRRSCCSPLIELQARSTEPAKTRSSPSPSLRSDTTVRSPVAAQANGESSVGLATEGRLQTLT